MDNKTIDQTITKSKKARQTMGEEIANSITHGLGALLSIAALVALLIDANKQSSSIYTLSLVIYGSTLLFMYLASMSYHSFQNEKLKKVLRIIDHSSIYMLIAGTYTPLALIYLRDSWGWPIFIAIWSMALGGIIFKVFFLGKMKKISVIFYLAMGWLGAVSLEPLLNNLPEGLLFWIIAGGLFYSLGLVFFGWKKLSFSHSIWHLFVLGGSLTHFIGIFKYLPY